MSFVCYIADYVFILKYVCKCVHIVHPHFCLFLILRWYNGQRHNLQLCMVLDGHDGERAVDFARMFLAGEEDTARPLDTKNVLSPPSHPLPPCSSKTYLVSQCILLLVRIISKVHEMVALVCIVTLAKMVNGATNESSQQ